MKKIFWIFICWLVLSMGASAADKLDYGRSSRKWND